MRLVWDKSGQVAKWAAIRLPVRGLTFGDCVGVGCVGEDGKPMGAVIFHDWQPQWSRIEFSMVVENPHCFTWNVAREVFAYPFYTANVNRLFGLTSHRNERLVKLAVKHFGFIREAAHKHHFGDDHAICIRMMRSEYERAFMRGKHGLGSPRTLAA